MVSIIVPAYNVEQYIERCIESLINQTFNAIEIIIVDDGSTDSTEEKCMKLAETDSRIKYIRKKNGGQGSARNLGILEAKYDYITFADSDDWCHELYVEKLYEAIVKYDSDIAVCNKYGVVINEDGSENKHVIRHWIESNKKLDVDEDHDLIYKIKYSLWAKMFKKSLFIENNIKQPDHKFENNTVMPILVAKSQSICFIEDSLYYYWLNRGESTINTFKSFLDMEKCLSEAASLFKENEIFDDYYESLMKFSVSNVKHTLRRAGSLLNSHNKCEYEKLKDDLISFLDMQYPEWTNPCDIEAYIWGSYNLRKIVSNIVVSPDQIKKHYSFSNVISAMSLEDSKNDEELECKNKYRNQMFKYDFNKQFSKMKKAEKCQSDYIFIDMLEERYDCVLMNNTIYTENEMFNDIKENFKFNYDIFSKNEEKYFEVWKEKCKDFMKVIQNNFYTENIIVVKMFLSSYVGKYRKDKVFNEINEIDRVNKYLNRCYEFIEENFNNIILYDVKDDNLNYTDENFMFGCHPYHLNENKYEQISTELLEYINL